MAFSANDGPVVITAIAGSGKDELLKLLLTTYGDRFGKAVSHTTRAPREGEVDGVAYYFVNDIEFDRLREEGAFIEEVSVHKNRYGMSRAAVADVGKQGKRCAMILDHHGLDQFRQQGLAPFAILIQAPPVDVVRKRMELRGDKPHDIATRLETAERERAYYDAHPEQFNARVCNDGTLADAWAELQTVLGL